MSFMMFYDEIMPNCDHQLTILPIEFVHFFAPGKVGKQSLGLSEHQVAAVMGWTTGAPWKPGVAAIW